MADDNLSTRAARKTADLGRILIKEELKARSKQISEILKTDDSDRTAEQKVILEQSPDIVGQLQRRAKERDNAKQRQLEVEDPMDVLDEKCRDLAEALRNSRNTVIYTGAGISTAASIPDYRGPKGIWTLLQQGKAPSQQNVPDLTEAVPTYTHMCIVKLLQEGLASYVVSQNCDGLHFRSGVPRKKLSELHGNMYIEICRQCKPSREYIRLFDVTEKTGVRKHATGRKCHDCHGDLEDTIVHFGEKGDFGTPHNWQEAADSAKKCEVILCIGSSLKVLKKYPCLWNMDKPVKKRPKLFIINLQWTPKDDVALLKINGKCDQVLYKVMCNLNLEAPPYNKHEDPLFVFSSALKQEEEDTTTKVSLVKPVVKSSCEDTRQISIRSLLGVNQDQEKMNSTSNSVHSGGGMKTKHFNLCDLINFAIIKTFKSEVDKEKPNTLGNASESKKSVLEAISRCEAEEARLDQTKVSVNKGLSSRPMTQYVRNTTNSEGWRDFSNSYQLAAMSSRPHAPHVSLSSFTSMPGHIAMTNSMMYSEHLRHMQRLGSNVPENTQSTAPMQDEPLNLSFKPQKIIHIDERENLGSFNMNSNGALAMSNQHSQPLNSDKASSVRSDNRNTMTSMWSSNRIISECGTTSSPHLSKETTSSEPVEGKRPNSIPGWYGKGFNPKKHKRKKSFT